MNRRSPQFDSVFIKTKRRVIEQEEIQICNPLFEEEFQGR